MGTRHLTCVMYENVYKIAQYGQWDGYPEGQGKVILGFLNNDFVKEDFIKKLDLVRFATPEELNEMWASVGADGSGWVSMDIADKFQKKYPENYRDTGAKILYMVSNMEKPLLLSNEIDFAKDSLFCEWAYVIDLDKNTFEVYRGFNNTPLDENERFYDGDSSKEYYPVRLVATFDLNNLPTEDDFIAQLTEEEESDE